MPSRRQRVKNLFHRALDPLAALPAQVIARRALAGLPDGEYRVPVDVPYVPQFASPDLIEAFIHGGLHGRDDPAWTEFGAPDPDGYDFWARRVCALACLKMAVQAFNPARELTLWTLVQQGLAYDGYRAYDGGGRLVDEGWFYPAIARLARDHGLQAVGRGYVPLEEICRLIRAGWLVAPAVTPELGKYGPLRRYGGHMVLAYGFAWGQGRCRSLCLHNPSGRIPELQAGAVIPADRFRKAYAHRLIAFRPDSA